MKSRVTISTMLLILGTILAFLPSSGNYSLHRKPDKVLADVLDAESYLTPDQVARFVVTEDSTIQLIDIRTPGEFNRFSIPGAINIPYDSMLSMDLESYLDRNIRNVFYGNGDLAANYAMVLATGLGFKSNYAMKGGLNEWYRVVMNSEFAGERITARENAVFEIRFKARKMFNEINSMPDSLKVKYKALKEIERKKLDGGCE